MCAISLVLMQHVVSPVFTRANVSSLACTSRLSIALDGTKYLPGIVGLNNIKANDYMNVVLHALAHVPPFRDYFLRPETYAHVRPPPGDQTFILGEPTLHYWPASGCGRLDSLLVCVSYHDLGFFLTPESQKCMH